ncbi:MAG TPA: hypothetical protein VNZ52_06910 [Candidatus Thermoplasmatota archaeon]|nr:hypothetical protein [Candidatus Thermoplasmatota archaeon]
MVNVGLPLALAFLALLVAAGLVSRRLEPRGRVVLALALIPATLLTAWGVVVVGRGLVTLASPASGSVALLAALSGLPLLAAGLALAVVSPWRKGWWALAGIPVLLLSVAVALRMSAVQPDGTLHPEEARAAGSLVVAGAASLAAAALFPAALACFAERQGWRSVVGFFLVLGLLCAPTVLTAPTLLTSTAGFEPARFTIAYEIQPEAPGVFTVVLPFVTTVPEKESLLAPLRDALRVVSGEGRLRWLNDSALELTGSGRVRLEAAHEFYGTVADGSAFTQTRFPDQNATLQPGSPAPLAVSLSVSARGMGHHTCSYAGEAEAWFRQPGTEPFRQPDEGFPREDPWFPVVCA